MFGLSTEMITKLQIGQSKEIRVLTFRELARRANLGHYSTHAACWI